MRKLFISPGSTLKQALRLISQTGKKCLVVANEKNELLGTLSDGDDDDFHGRLCNRLLC